MIGSLLTKIGGLFEKEYLFASFLPALIFVTAVAGTLFAVTGVEAVSVWIDSWSALQKAALGGASGVFVVVVGYVLHGLRPFFKRFWSGNITWYPLRGFVWIGEQLQQRQYRRLRTYAKRISPWRNVFDDFRTQAKAKWSAGHPIVPADEIQQLVASMEDLNESLGSTRVSRSLQPLVEAYGRYSIDSLTPAYQALRERLDDWDERECMRIQRDTSTLDRRFATLATVKATGLGNVIESFNRYPFTRYGMEGEVFWPRLQHVIKTEFSNNVRDQQILLDFSVTLASLAALYGLLALVGGPWIWYSKPLWILVALVATSISLFCYFLAVDAAMQLGDLVRASFDLFRIDLMAALGLVLPESVASERLVWKRVSELVVYGELPESIELRKRPETP